jgi:hypothetical protein
MSNNYTIEKHRGLWRLIDAEGYETNYVGYDTKKEALEAAKIRTADDARLKEEEKTLEEIMLPQSMVNSPTTRNLKP